MNLLITAGPTREHLDDVRFISNPSTGKMGIALAERALVRGHEVVLVLGPTHLEPPSGAEVHQVVSTQDMYDAVWNSIEVCPPDGAVMTAAPCDFRPHQRIAGKQKKGGRDTWELTLVSTPDILASVGTERKPAVLVGFALESERVLEYARAKVEKKNLDFIVANSPKTFGTSDIESTLVFSHGETRPLGNLAKGELAEVILDEMEKVLGSQPSDRE